MRTSHKCASSCCKQPAFRLVCILATAAGSRDRIPRRAENMQALLRHMCAHARLLYIQKEKGFRSYVLSLTWNLRGGEPHIVHVHGTEMSSSSSFCPFRTPKAICVPGGGGSFRTSHPPCLTSSLLSPRCHASIRPAKHPPPPAHVRNTNFSCHLQQHLRN